MPLDDDPFRYVSDSELKESLEQLLRLFHAYETGAILTASCWKELLHFLTPEDTRQIPFLSASYH